MLHLPLSAALVAHLEVVEETGSTNADLLRAAEGLPAPAVLVAESQTAGRGRLGRTWSARPGDSLAVSVLLRPAVPRDRLGWLSLGAGAAMTQALVGLGLPASAKWPNDVLLRGRKVCGVLAEALPEAPSASGRRGPGVVIGAGLNHLAPEGALPVPTATSIAVEGGPTDPDVLVAAYLRALLAAVAAFEAAGGDPEASGLRTAVVAASGTLGREVRATLPDGSVLVGRAVAIDGDGRIRIRIDTGPIRGTVSVAAADVEHLRYE